MKDFSDYRWKIFLITDERFFWIQIKDQSPYPEWASLRFFWIQIQDFSEYRRKIDLHERASHIFFWIQMKGQYLYPERVSLIFFWIQMKDFSVYRWKIFSKWRMKNFVLEGKIQAFLFWRQIKSLFWIQILFWRITFR